MYCSPGKLNKTANHGFVIFCCCESISFARNCKSQKKWKCLLFIRTLQKLFYEFHMFLRRSKQFWLFLLGENLPVIQYWLKLESVGYEPTKSEEKHIFHFGSPDILLLYVTTDDGANQHCQDFQKETHYMRMYSVGHKQQ